jgi:hypothetical protein
MQRALMHYFKPCNRALVLQALKKAGREDLIGWGPECLIPPYERKSGAEGKPLNRGRRREDSPLGSREAPGRPGKRPDNALKDSLRIGRRRTDGKHNDTGRQPAKGRKTR